MVSCNPMVAKKLYCDPFEFVPQWKIWVVANTQPEVDADDGAMWRRIKVLPFTQSIAEDKQGAHRRSGRCSPGSRCARAILAWLVKGCLMWQKRGSAEPPIVREASQAYRESNDTFNPFFEAHYELDPNGFVPGSDIREAYKAYAREILGGVLLAPALLNQRLREKGLVEGQSGSNRERGRRGGSNAGEPRPTAAAAEHPNRANIERGEVSLRTRRETILETVFRLFRCSPLPAAPGQVHMQAA